MVERGELAFLNAPIDPVKTFAVLRQLLNDAAKPEPVAPIAHSSSQPPTEIGSGGGVILSACRCPWCNRILGRVSSWAEELGPFMSTVRLKCSCGHSWEYPVGEPVPADLRTICPAGPSADDVPAPGWEPLPNAAPEVRRFGLRGHGGDQSRRDGCHFQRREIAMYELVAEGHEPDRSLEQPVHVTALTRRSRASAPTDANIVTVFQADLDGPFPYVAMEYVPGIDLLRLVRKVGPLP